MMWLTDLMIDYFPMYNKFRAPASWLVVAELTMPLLAVLALKEMYEQKAEFWREHRWAVVGSFGFTALVCLLTWLIPSMFGSYSQQEHEQLIATGQLQMYPSVDAAIRAVRGAMVSGDAMRSLLFLVLGCAVLLAYRMKNLNPMVSTLALAAIVLVDMGLVNKRYVDRETFVPAEEVEVARGYAPRPVDTQILQDKQHYRVLDLQHFAEAMPSYFHKTVGGYHAAKLTRYNDLINRQITKNNQQVINMLNTKYVIVDDNTMQQNPGALGNAWFVDSLVWVKNADQEMAALDSLPVRRAAVADEQFRDVLKAAQPVQPGDTIALTSYAANKLTFKSHSANGGLAVFSEIYFPWGWRATIDGQEAPIGRVNYVLRAMQLPAGDHTIEMTYDPQEVHQTETMATTAILVIFLVLLLAANLALFSHLRQRKSATQE